MVVCFITNSRLHAVNNYTVSLCKTAHLIHALLKKCVFRHVQRKQVMETYREERKDRKEKKAAALFGCIFRRAGGVPSQLVE